MDESVSACAGAGFFFFFFFLVRCPPPAPPPPPAPTRPGRPRAPGGVAFRMSQLRRGLRPWMRTTLSPSASLAARCVGLCSRPEPFGTTRTRPFDRRGRHPPPRGRGGPAPRGGAGGGGPARGA